MENSRAKTILIIALFISNALLIFDAYKKMNYNFDDYNSKKKYQIEIKNILDKKNISVDSEFEYFNKDIGTISLTHYKYNQDIVDSLFSEDDGIVSLENDNKRLKYEGFLDLKKFDKEEVVSKIENFLDKFSSDNERYLKSINYSDEFIMLSYSQKYEDLYLDGGFMSFSVRKDGNFTMRREWLKVIEKGDKKKQPISSIIAVLRALDQIEPDSNIIDINLGYYINLDEMLKVQRSTAFPHWKISYKTKDNAQEDIYIEALEL
ncbi:MAG: hypothetical protein N4A54_13090 [Peptostreptococcaceae bacterium]|jgi:hypothetical protein|nr:hypothetical protein [Peptostreptococcaceae bacterium]